MCNNKLVWNKRFCPDAMKEKLCFKTKENAENYIINKKTDNSVDLTTYWCGCCNCWHLTHLKLGEFKRKKNDTTSKKKYYRKSSRII